jgi:hypothetical protein
MVNVTLLKRQIRQKRQTVNNLEIELKKQLNRLFELETKAKKSKFKKIILG